MIQVDVSDVVWFAKLSSLVDRVTTLEIGGEHEGVCDAIGEICARSYSSV